MAVKVTLNGAAVKQLLRSAEVKADLERRARNIAAAAGPGFEVSSELHPLRWRAEVRTATTEARRAEATTRALSRALDAGRR